VTIKEREDRFIEETKADGIPMTFETEMIMRYAYSRGASELERVAFDDGAEHQRLNVLAALGAVPAKRMVRP
jgi:hypothetical protein